MSARCALRSSANGCWGCSPLSLIAGSYFCFTAIGTDLLPAMDEGGFIVDYIMPAGASLQETNRVITHIEKILLATPEVENISRRTGMELGPAQVTEPNTGDISVKLKRQPRRSADDVIADVRAKIKKAEPVCDIEVVQLLQDMIGDLTSAPEPVVIKLFDQDPALLNQWAPTVGEAIKKIPGVVDVEDGIENTISGPARTFSVDPVAAARAGFSAQELELDASAVMQGEQAPNPVVINDRSYNIRVRFPEQYGKDLDSIRKTLLISGTGKTATLGSLANDGGRPGAGGDQARESAARRAGNGALRASRSGHRHEGGTADYRRSQDAAQHPREIWRAVR